MSKNATFFQRLGAIFIDVLLISFVVSLFSSVLVDNVSYNKLTSESSKVMEDYVNKKIDVKTYINKESDISYDLSRKTAGVSILSIAVYILYFIIFQYKNNGQTIGKKLLKIRVVSNNEEKLNINNFVYRSLIVNNIFIDLILLAMVIIGTKNIYSTCAVIIDGIKYILVFSIVIMVLFRKDKKGLHDLVANTKVIKEV